MRILILHLSDSHFKTEKDVECIDSNAILSAVSSTKRITGTIDECIIIFSGDLTFSGSSEQFDIVNTFIDRLRNGMESIISNGVNDNAVKKIIIACVPGNHDNYFDNGSSMTHDELVNLFNNSDKIELERIYFEDIKHLSNYYAFYDNLNCEDSDRKHDAIEVKYIKYDDFCLRINLLNSAPFSLISKDNGDKGWHYFLEKDLSKLRPTDKEQFTITVIHHDINWFRDDIRERLRNLFREGSDFIFFGHEHIADNEEIHSKGSIINTSCGYSLSGTHSVHGFIVNVLDTENKSIIQCDFEHDEKAGLYRQRDMRTLDKLDLIAGKNFKFDSEFQAFLEEDSGQRKGNRFEDYFVFPSLEEDLGDSLKKSEINTAEGLFDILGNSSKIEITGARRSGKTTLAKYLCLHMAGRFVPLFIDADDIIAKKVNPDKIIKFAFDKNYGKIGDYDAFLQLDNAKKVMIVDNKEHFDSQSWVEFCDESYKIVGKIVYFTDFSLKPNIEKRALEAFSEEKTAKLRITPFYYKKRNALIEKIYKIVEPHVGSVSDIEETVKKINNDMMNQIARFEWNPEFIYQYVSYYVNQPLDQRVDSHIISNVYDINIKNSLARNIGDDSDINEIITVLDCVAYKIYETKSSFLSVNEFQSVVDQYNEQHDLNVRAKDVIEIAKKSNILSDVSDGSLDKMFCDQNLLSYFLARHLNRELNEDVEMGKKDLTYLVNNISYAYYGNVLLFLSFIKEDLRIINPILEAMDRLMSEWDEFSIDADNIKFLSNSFVDDSDLDFEQSLPNEEDKEKNIEQKEAIEKKISENAEHESLQDYDYSKSAEYLNSTEGQISNAIAYLDFLSKILPSFRHILKKDPKKDIVEKIYKYPNKLLYFILHKFDINFNDYYLTISDTLKKYPKTSRGMLITPEMIKSTIRTVSMAMILSVYDAVFNSAVDNKGIEDLNNFSYRDNSNYTLENIMMEESRGADINIFAPKVMSLYSEASSKVLKKMTEAVVRVYYLNHNVDMHGTGQKLADTFFGKQNRKKLSIIQARNSRLNIQK